MRKKKHQIIMLFDNYAVHSDDVRLTNVKLVFMPNTTSLIQHFFHTAFGASR